ncbi:unnamed protein product [Prunus armeniaca]|uniref:Uncharacterized protein n=1 Tax=Prunus armeniaca TaxID=36596 RepID=A0A6J5TDB8_PRUAR|nr:unnamed protein product [Prunus armeniaca]
MSDFRLKEHQDVSPPIVARIPKSCVTSVLMPSISVAEGETKDSKMEEKVNKILEPAKSLCHVLSYQVLILYLMIILDPTFWFWDMIVFITKNLLPLISKEHYLKQQHVPNPRLYGRFSSIRKMSGDRK